MFSTHARDASSQRVDGTQIEGKSNILKPKPLSNAAYALTDRLVVGHEQRHEHLAEVSRVGEQSYEASPPAS